MDELPADTEVAVDDAGLASGDAMTNGADFAELFDIDMDELARMLALVATNGLGRLEALRLQAQPTKNATHGRWRDAGLARDLRARPALAPQPLDPFDDLLWCRSAQAMRPRGAILKAGHAFREVPRDPFADRARADAYGFATAFGVCPLNTCRTIRSRPRGVRRAFLWMSIRSSRESLKLRNLSFLGRAEWTTY